MKTKIKFLVALLLIHNSCKKDESDHGVIAETSSALTFELKEAQSYLQNLPSDSSAALKKLNIDWTNATNKSTNEGSAWRIKLKGHPTYQNYEQGHRELIIGKDSATNKISARILEVIPDAIYLQRNARSSSKTFTGRIFEYDLNYKLQTGSLYSGGQSIGHIKADSLSLKDKNLGLKTLNPLSGAQGKLMLMQVIETCSWYQDSYINGDGELVIHSSQVCSYSITGDGGGYAAYATTESGGGGGGGGSGSTSTDATDPVMKPSNLPGENNAKVDPKKMMDCFSNIADPNAAFVVRVYVVEPLPGTSFNVGSNSFGHVAISMSKSSGSTTITQTVGFYPTGSGLSKLSSKSQILDNGDMEFNVSSTYYVNGSNFEKLINFVSNPPADYDFMDYNCSAFVYSAGVAAGIPIPNPTTSIGVSGPGGVTYAMTPAGMASALREQKAANRNIDINEAGGRAAASNGPCNK